MGWIRISDDYYDHAKFAEVGPIGVAVWLAGLAYCNRNLTDGFIPRTAANRLICVDGLGIFTGNFSGEDATVEDGIQELVESGLWIKVPRGYQVHDYLDYQPSGDEVRAKRERNAFRQAQFRRRKHEQGEARDA
jgi:hypothetical protein